MWGVSAVRGNGDGVGRYSFGHFGLLMEMGLFRRVGCEMGCCVWMIEYLMKVAGRSGIADVTEGTIYCLM